MFPSERTNERPRSPPTGAFQFSKQMNTEVNKLEVIDHTTFDLITRLKIKTIYNYSKNVWYCQTSIGNPVTLKYEKGFLLVGFGENEYQANIDLVMIAVNELRPDKIELKDILDLLKWKVRDEDIWDG